MTTRPNNTKCSCKACHCRKRIDAEGKMKPGSREIVLPCFGIVVRLANAEPQHSRPSLAGEITSNLHDGDSGSEDDSEYEAAIDGIESLILAHACAGVDITASAYIAGIETAVEAASSRL